MTFVLQFTNVTKTVIGVDTVYEAITIAHIVTDDDGSLKIKYLEEFVDSKVLTETIQAYAAAAPK